MKKIIFIAVMLLTGCAVQPPTRVVYVQAPPPPPAPEVYRIPAPLPVVSIYVEPPLYQPPPIRIAWAPPPMLVEVPPPLPYFGAVWTGGYWVWEGNWVWARGRWVAPPRPDYAWVNPYYEHRAGSVIFVNGFWAAPGVSFVAPSLNLNIAFGVVAAGIVAGPRPIGPEGIFIPAPPGSYAGLIVPAPIGTAPAVVTGAPPIIRTGMHVNIVNNTTTINNVTNVTNVTVVAPASATANGQAVNAAIPAQPHLAAAMPPVVRALAPEPASAKPIPALVPGRAAIVLPTAQMVHPDMLPAALHQHALVQGHLPPTAQGAFSSQAIPMPAPHSVVPAAAPTSQIPSAATSKSLEPAATIGKQEAKSNNADAAFKTDIAAGRDGTAKASDGVKRVASRPVNSGELRQPNTLRDPASVPANVTPAKLAPVTKPPTRSGDAPQGKPVKRPEVKRLEMKKPMEAERTAEKHPHE